MKFRHDYFLMWGHALYYKENIINLIDKNENFSIKYFYKYKIRN